MEKSCPGVWCIQKRFQKSREGNLFPLLSPPNFSRWGRKAASIRIIASTIAFRTSGHSSSSSHPPDRISYLIRQARFPSNRCHSNAPPNFSSITFRCSRKRSRISRFRSPFSWSVSMYKSTWASYRWIEYTHCKPEIPLEALSPLSGPGEMLAWSRVLSLVNSSKRVQKRCLVYSRPGNFSFVLPTTDVASLGPVISVNKGAGLKSSIRMASTSKR